MSPSSLAPTNSVLTRMCCSSGRRAPSARRITEVSDAGLIGGGSISKLGEVSLAHHGVLFLDELPEFKREVLEVLHHLLEEGRLTISRASLTA